LKITAIENEFELESAHSFFNKLRLLAKDDPLLLPMRTHLTNLIEAYEAEYWADEKKVKDQQLKTSDQAEKIIHFQNQFIQQRKKRIRQVLKKIDLNQNNLAKILGHRKNYMSELINGARPFSQEDIIIINRILGIKLEHLVVPVIRETVVRRIRLAIQELNKPKLKLKDNDLELA
jgi:transcriptional regulator with XRE-family HTH domain